MMEPPSNFRHLYDASNGHMTITGVQAMIEGMRVLALELDCLIKSAETFTRQDRTKTRQAVEEDAQSLLAALAVFGCIRPVGVEAS